MDSPAQRRLFADELGEIVHHLGSHVAGLPVFLLGAGDGAGDEDVIQGRVAARGDALGPGEAAPPQVEIDFRHLEIALAV